MARWCSRLRTSRFPNSGHRLASDVLAQKYFRKAGVPLAPEEGRGRDRAVLALAFSRRSGCAGGAAENERASSARFRPSRCSTAWPELGPTGAGRAAISTPRPTLRPSSTSIATCSRCRCRRRTRRSWFNTGLHGPMASTARARATTTSTSRPASWSSRRPPTSTRSRTPASSRASMTTSSTRRHHGPVGA